MPQFDLNEAELSLYRTRTPSPDDLDEFWSTTLAEARALRRPTTVEPVQTGLRLVASADVTFTGFDGDLIKAWYHRPAGCDGDLPTIVRFQGYGGGRGLSHQVSMWVMAGYACIEIDTRGQGAGSSPGSTADPGGSAPAYPGFLTRGILSPATYYYRRVFTDAVMAYECARSLPGVDRGAVVVAGGSQGGGISLAVAALVPGIAAVMPDVPFLSDIRRGVEIGARPPYTELTRFLAVHRDAVEAVWRTLAYFDVAVLATRCDAPALFSVALMDETCPPSTVYAAYNAYGGPKEIRVYPFNDHEGGLMFHEREQLAWLAERVPSPI